MIKKIADILHDYRRVLSVAKKPTTNELKEIIRVCAIGMSVIGAIGFAFFVIFSAFGG